MASLRYVLNFTFCKQRSTSSLLSRSSVTSTPALPHKHRSSSRFFATDSSSNKAQQLTGRSLRIILVGVPGCGKGTQSAKVENDYGSIQISTGQILRQSVSHNTPLAETLKKQMASGGLVSDDIMLQVIEKELGAERFKQKGWILDGFPRTVGQAKQLDIILKKIHQPLDFVFYLDVPEDVVISRISERYIHPGSGRVYNSSFNPPKVPGKDDVTGEDLFRREDDDSNTVRLRLNSYREQTEPMLKFFQVDNRLIRIDSPTSAVGYVQIKQILDDYIKSPRPSTLSA